VDCLPGVPLESILLIPILAQDQGTLGGAASPGRGRGSTLSAMGSPSGRDASVFSGRVVGILALHNKVQSTGGSIEEDAVVAETAALPIAVELRSEHERKTILARIQHGVS